MVETGKGGAKVLVSTGGSHDSHISPISPPAPMALTLPDDDTPAETRANASPAAESRPVEVRPVEVRPAEMHPAERHPAERRLAKARTAGSHGWDERFRALVHHSSDAMAVLDADARIGFANAAVQRLVGCGPDALMGVDALSLVHPDDRAEAAAGLLSVTGPDHERHPVQIRLRRQDGTWVWTEALAENLLADPLINGIMVTARDITDRRFTADLLACQTAILELIARGAALPSTLHKICALVTERDEGAMAAVFLVEGGHLRLGASVGVPPEWVAVTAAVPIGMDGASCGIAAQSGTTVVVPDIATDTRWAAWRQPAMALGLRASWSTPITDHAAARVIGTFAVYYREVTAPSPPAREIVALAVRLAELAIERQLTADRMEYQALHDPLTDLPNRTLVLDRLHLALTRARRGPQTTALLFLDLDSFKVINDSLGHAAGDRLLRAAAKRLAGAVRPWDTVGRFGGDEFVVLCEGLAKELIAILAQPFDLDGRQVVVTASIGIALQEDGAADPTRLVQNADTAMYRAKERGRALVEVFDEGLRERARLRHETEQALRQALDRNELRLNYQPMVRIETGETVGVEALVRWAHPTRGLLAPSDFVALAEETGLIVAIGEWVLAEACRQIAAWSAAGQPPLSVAVNLSARHLGVPNLAAHVGELIERHGIDPAHLCLEITETVLVDEAATMMSRLDQLRALGVQIAIDDFGTGYSSLSYLKLLSVDKLKIDASFVRNLVDDHRDRAIVGAVIQVARALDLTVVAEGVEAPEQLPLLSSLGCAVVQGHLVAQAMTGEELTSWLSEPRGWTDPGDVTAGAQ